MLLNVAFVAHLLSSSLYRCLAIVALLIHEQSKLLVVGMGFLLNFLSPAFLNLARRFSASCLLVWILYLKFLVFFGTVIDTWIE